MCSSSLSSRNSVYLISVVQLQQSLHLLKFFFPWEWCHPLLKPKWHYSTRQDECTLCNFYCCNKLWLLITLFLAAWRRAAGPPLWSRLAWNSAQPFMFSTRWTVVSLITTVFFSGAVKDRAGGQEESQVAFFIVVVLYFQKVDLFIPNKIK